jgi:hypothetical protein
VTAYRMNKLLAADADRAAVLSRFVENLTPEDESVLAHLLGRSSEGERR